MGGGWGGEVRSGLLNLCFAFSSPRLFVSCLVCPLHFAMVCMICVIAGLCAAYVPPFCFFCGERRRRYNWRAVQIYIRFWLMHIIIGCLDVFCCCWLFVAVRVCTESKTRGVYV